MSIDFADYFANAPIGFHCLGPDGVIVAVNEAELALLGYARHDYVGHHVREFYVDPGVADDILSALLRGEAIVGRRVQLRAKDGTPTPVVLSANALVIDGRLVYTRGLIREIRGEIEANRAAEVARRRAAFLADASRVLAGWVDHDTTLGAIAEHVIAHHADACLIDVADENGRLRRVAAATRDRSITQLAREFLDRYPPDPAGPHPIATAIRTGESVLHAQMSDAFFDAIAHDAEHRRLTRELGLKSSIVVPMIARGRPLGAISLFASHSVPAYGLEDLALAEDLTRRVAFAVENAHLHRESERRLQEAELVAQVARDINASLNLDTVMQRIVDTARELCHADLAAIFLREGLEAAAVPRYGAGGAPSSRYRTVRIEPGKGLGGQVLLTGTAVRTANYPEDPRFSEEYRKLPESERIVALLAVPIRYGDYVRGLLYVANRTARAFSDRDEAVVQRLGDHAAVAIQKTPDLLVSDIGMPGMDGYAFIRQVRALQATGRPRIPAIAVTAYGRVEDRIRILDAGFQMHITKPVDPAELVAALASLGPRAAL